MRILDYTRLGLANIRTHKKRAFTVVVIVGVIFGVLTAGDILIQGAEDAIISKMTEPTSGKVLLSVTAEQRCYDECERINTAQIIEQAIKESGGEIIPSRLFMDGTTSYLAVKPEVLSGLGQMAINVPDDSVPMFGAPSVLAGFFGISRPASDTSADTKLQAVAKLRESALDKTVTMGEVKYSIVGITPSSFGVGNFSLMSVGERINPLNLIMDIIPAGGGTTFILDDGNLPEQNFADSPATLVMFWDTEEALSFQKAMAARTCSPDDYYKKVCPSMVDYRAEPVFSSPLAAKETFQAIWRFYHIIEMVLIMIAGVVVMSTYTRLIGRDTKVIAFYRALGANHRQIAGVYCIYLLGISLIASVFAILLGVILVAILNIANGNALTNIFVLAFSAESQPVVFFGANGDILILAGVMLLLAPISAVANYARFTGSKLSQKLK